MSNFLPMPIKTKPYFHQQQVFDFACRKFGITAPSTSSKKKEMLSVVPETDYRLW